MINLFRTVASSVALAAVVSFAASAQADGGKRYYEVTVSNLAYAQPISPPVLVTHKSGLSLFNVNEPASDGLAAMAEDADNSGLVADLLANPKTRAVVVGEGPIPPGGSATLVIEASAKARFLSAVGMLVNTNDAFFGLRHYSLPRSFKSRRSVRSPAYDAGSEANNEDCGFIPGPACGNAFVRDEEGAEGFVHIHRGVHGVADLAAEVYDWRNPTVQISIRRVRKP